MKLSKFLQKKIDALKNALAASASSENLLMLIVNVAILKKVQGSDIQDNIAMERLLNTQHTQRLNNPPYSHFINDPSLFTDVAALSGEPLTTFIQKLESTPLKEWDTTDWGDFKAGMEKSPFVKPKPKTGDKFGTHHTMLASALKQRQPSTGSKGPKKSANAISEERKRALEAKLLNTTRQPSASQQDGGQSDAHVSQSKTGSDADVTPPPPPPESNPNLPPPPPPPPATDTDGNWIWTSLNARSKGSTAKQQTREESKRAQTRPPIAPTKARPTINRHEIAAQLGKMRGNPSVKKEESGGESDKPNPTASPSSDGGHRRAPNKAPPPVAQKPTPAKLAGEIQQKLTDDMTIGDLLQMILTEADKVASGKTLGSTQISDRLSAFRGKFRALHTIPIVGTELLRDTHGVERGLQQALEAAKKFNGDKHHSHLATATAHIASVCAHVLGQQLTTTKRKLALSSRLGMEGHISSEKLKERCLDICQALLLPMLKKAELNGDQNVASLRDELDDLFSQDIAEENLKKMLCAFVGAIQKFSPSDGHKTLTAGEFARQAVAEAAKALPNQVAAPAGKETAARSGAEVSTSRGRTMPHAKRPKTEQQTPAQKAFDVFLGSMNSHFIWRSNDIRITGKSNVSVKDALDLLDAALIHFKPSEFNTDELKSMLTEPFRVADNVPLNRRDAQTLVFYVEKALTALVKINSNDLTDPPASQYYVARGISVSVANAFFVDDKKSRIEHRPMNPDFIKDGNQDACLKFGSDLVTALAEPIFAIAYPAETLATKLQELSQCFTRASDTYELTKTEFQNSPCEVELYEQIWKTCLSIKSNAGHAMITTKKANEILGKARVCGEARTKVEKAVHQRKLEEQARAERPRGSRSSKSANPNKASSRRKGSLPKPRTGLSTKPAKTAENAYKSFQAGMRDLFSKEQPNVTVKDALDMLDAALISFNSLEFDTAELKKLLTEPFRVAEKVPLTKEVSGIFSTHVNRALTALGTIAPGEFAQKAHEVSQHLAVAVSAAVTPSFSPTSNPVEGNRLHQLGCDENANQQERLQFGSDLVSALAKPVFQKVYSTAEFPQKLSELEACFARAQDTDELSKDDFQQSDCEAKLLAQISGTCQVIQRNAVRGTATKDDADFILGAAKKYGATRVDAEKTAHERKRAEQKMAEALASGARDTSDRGRSGVSRKTIDFSLAAKKKKGPPPVPEESGHFDDALARGKQDGRLSTVKEEPELTIQAQREAEEAARRKAEEAQRLAQIAELEKQREAEEAAKAQRKAAQAERKRAEEEEEARELRELLDLAAGETPSPRGSVTDLTRSRPVEVSPPDSRASSMHFDDRTPMRSGLHRSPALDKMLSKQVEIDGEDDASESLTAAYFFQFDVPGEDGIELEAQIRALRNVCAGKPHGVVTEYERLLVATGQSLVSQERNTKEPIDFLIERWREIFKQKVEFYASVRFNYMPLDAAPGFERHPSIARIRELMHGHFQDFIKKYVLGIPLSTASEARRSYEDKIAGALMMLDNCEELQNKDNYRDLRHAQDAVCRMWDRYDEPQSDFNKKLKKSKRFDSLNNVLLQETRESLLPIASMALDERAPRKEKAVLAQLDRATNYYTTSQKRLPYLSKFLPSTDHAPADQQAFLHVGNTRVETPRGGDLFSTEIEQLWNDTFKTSDGEHLAEGLQAWENTYLSNRTGISDPGITTRAYPGVPNVYQTHLQVEKRALSPETPAPPDFMKLRHGFLVPPAKDLKPYVEQALTAQLGRKPTKDELKGKIEEIQRGYAIAAVRAVIVGAVLAKIEQMEQSGMAKPMIFGCPVLIQTLVTVGSSGLLGFSLEKEHRILEEEAEQVQKALSTSKDPTALIASWASEDTKEKLADVTLTKVDVRLSNRALNFARNLPGSTHTAVHSLQADEQWYQAAIDDLTAQAEANRAAVGKVPEPSAEDLNAHAGAETLRQQAQDLGMKARDLAEELSRLLSQDDPSDPSRIPALRQQIANLRAEASKLMNQADTTDEIYQKKTKTPGYLTAMAEELDGRQSYAQCALDAWKKASSNMEKAAFEQLLMSAVGMRSGGCQSGKDREECVTIHALAQHRFYCDMLANERPGYFYGHPPKEPKQSSSDKASDKKLYHQYVAKEYLTLHGPHISDDNYHGREGTKNMWATLGGDICSAIRAAIKDRVKQLEVILDESELVHSQFQTQAERADLKAHIKALKNHGNAIKIFTKTADMKAKFGGWFASSKGEHSVKAHSPDKTVAEREKHAKRATKAEAKLKKIESKAAEPRLKQEKKRHKGRF